MFLARRTSIAAVAALLCTSVVATAQQQPLRLTFGAYSFKKATEVYKQFQPATKELSRLLSTGLERPVEVAMSITKTYEECVNNLVEGHVDMVRVGPASYVLAKRRNAKIQIIAAENEDSHNVGLIVVREDSAIHTLADLKGKKFAFGDEQSTIGRYLSQAELVRAGVFAKDLAEFKYLERHDIVFKAVEIGDFDAGALHLDTFNELNKKAKQKLRVLSAFDNVPKPWVVRADLDANLAKTLRASLLDLKDPAALKTLKVPGLRAATDKEYDLVREGMEVSERFLPAVEATSSPAPTVPPAPTKG